MANKRHSDESSLKQLIYSVWALPEWILLSADFSNQKQQSRAYRCAYDVSKIFISQCKQIQWLMGVFESAWILAWLKSMIIDNVNAILNLFLYNKQGRIYLLSWHRQNDILGPPSLLIGLYNSTTPAKKTGVHYFCNNFNGLESQPHIKTLLWWFISRHLSCFHPEVSCVELISCAPHKPSIAISKT